MITGSIDHVSIRQLQLMLLKFALILGVDFIENITFDGICPQNLVTSLSDEQIKQGQKENGHKVQPNIPKSDVTSSQCASINGKRKMQFLSGLTTSKEEDEEEHDSSDQVDGNVCGRRPSGAQVADRRAKQESRSAKSCISLADRNDSGTESENELLADDNERRAVSRAQSAGSSIRRKGSGIKDRMATPSSPSACDRHNGLTHTCGCCCHMHSAGGRYWDVDEDMADYQIPGAFAHFSITSANPATASPFTDYERILERLHAFQFNVILGADGRRNTLADHFPRKEFRGRLAIAITANFVNTHTLTEAQIPEISGISFIYNQQLFRYDFPFPATRDASFTSLSDVSSYILIQPFTSL